MTNASQPFNTLISRRHLPRTLAAVGIAAHAAIGTAAAVFIANRKTTAGEINEWLAAPSKNGVHRFRGSVTIDSPVIIPSNRILDATGATIRLVDGANSNLVKNKNAVVPDRILDDVETVSGSAAISSEAAHFTDDDLGRSLVIAGAGGNGNGPLTGVITAILDTRTATLSESATASVSGAQGKIFIRDTNITILGGTWDRGTSLSPVALDRHGLLFRHVDRLHVDIEKYLSTEGSKFAVSAGDLRWFRLALRDAQTTSDGIHVTGPASRGEIPYVAGTTGDDLLAFTCADYAGYDDVSGDINDVVVGQVLPRNALKAVKVLSGAGRTLDSLKIEGPIRGSVRHHGVWIGDDTQETNTVGGTYGSIDLGLIDLEVGAAQFSDLYLGCPTARRISASIRHRPTSPGNVSVSIWGSSLATIENLILTDCDWSGAALKQAVSVSSTTTTVEYLSLTRPRQSGTSSLVSITAGSISNAVVRDGVWNSTGSDGTFFINGGDVASLQVISCAGVYSPTGFAVRINKGNLAAVTFYGGSHKRLSSLIRSFAEVRAVIVLDGCNVTDASRVAQLIGSATIVLGNPIFDDIRSSAPIHITTGPAVILGEAQKISTAKLVDDTSSDNVWVIGNSLPGGATPYPSGR